MIDVLIDIAYALPLLWVAAIVVTEIRDAIDDYYRNRRSDLSRGGPGRLLRPGRAAHHTRPLRWEALPAMRGALRCAARRSARTLELLSPSPPAWFDPSYAGERWDEDE
jgi:hypothetical protein